MARSVITVSQLNLYIRTLLESDSRLAMVSVSGEISNLKIHYASGHIYFTLKDSGSAIRSVMFKSNAMRLRTSLNDGMKVTVVGRVSVYERDGNYQLYAEQIIPDGEGDLMLQFEQIKERLEKEGLFDPSRKKRLPKFPKEIAVITSDTGAAVRDIFSVLGRRWPLSDVVLCPSLVQGAEAPKSLASALETVIASGTADTIIIGRGGGSIEDLWAFNDETLARKIAECPIPVISAVGHETDFTICDFVADMRAPTPSAAAELAVPDIEEIKASVFGYENLIKMRTLGKITLHKTKLKTINAGLKNPKALIIEKRLNNTDKLNMSIRNSFERTLLRRQKQFSFIAAKIDALSPLKTLSRGYTAVSKNGKPLISTSGLCKQDKISLRFNDGQADCEVLEVKSNGK